MAPVAKKRLVVCLDGTWNTPDDKKHPTNVVKLMRAISPGTRVPQVAFYDKGVGTGGPIDRLRGGAFGRGLVDNIWDGYRFLANNFVAGRERTGGDQGGDPGDATGTACDDEIYIFGFSRGAFTARSLAGFIGTVGLLDKETLGDLPKAWELYRMHPDKRPPDEVEALGGRRPKIQCVGVWDTVGALGIPLRGLRRLAGHKHQFHNTGLAKDIQVALHAIAIDEKRGPFCPTLWQTPQHDDQVVEQAWFPGVHSNVGGSYDDPGLSDLALEWMIQRLREHTELEFRDGWQSHVDGDHTATLYESRTALYALWRAFPFQRVIGGHDDWTKGWLARNKPDEGKQYVNELLHWSAKERFGTVADHQKGRRKWDPANVKHSKDHMRWVDKDGSIRQP